MEKVKCECNFTNPPGTAVCESCGKPLQEDDENTLLNMRYEGVARRSQTYRRTIVDKIWVFFSSVKVGIWIIVLLLLASALGTIYPQEMYIPATANPAVYYAEEYGITGELYYKLGFHNLYSSWWYMILLAALGISLLISSLDRAVPLYRALKNQRVTRHGHFMKRQRLFGKSKVENVDEAFAQATKRLKEKKYNISEEDGNIVAEKGRFSRWGPYVNHTGIIIFLIGCMLRYFPDMYVDQHMWIREGETAVVPETGGKYHVKNERFIVELYDEEDEVFKEALERAGDPVVKTYQTDAILYEQKESGTVGEKAELVPIKEHQIKVNDPLQFDGFSLYQIDYKLNELNEMSFTIEHKESGETFGKIDIDLFDPEDAYDLGDGYRVEVMQYFPDYYLKDGKEPSTQSRVPNNPVFIFNIITPDTPEGEVSFVGIRQNLEPFGDNEYKMTFVDVDMKHVTALTVRKDKTLGFLIAGGIIFMIGLVQGSYWSHRRVWLQRINGEVWVAAHTNKNYYALSQEIEYAVEGTDIEPPIDQLEEKENEQKQADDDG